MPDMDDAVLERIAANIVLTHAPFSNLYDALALEIGVDPLMVARLFGGGNQGSVVVGLKTARDQGWLDQLCLRLLSVGAFPGMSDAPDVVRMDFQGIVQPRLGYLQVDQL